MNKILTSIKLTVLAFGVSFAINSIARDGQHNDKYCYVTMPGGNETSSPCSARGTTCHADKSCSIDGIPGIGVQKDGAQKARAKSKLKLKSKTKPQSKKTNPKDH